MALVDELTTGPLAAEIAPHLVAGSENVSAIFELFYRRNIQVYSKITVGVFADWLAITGLRSAVENHSTDMASPLRNNALSIIDLLRGSHDYPIDFGEASKRALLEQWVTNGDITAAQREELLAKSLTFVCRANQLDYPVTLLSIRDAIGMASVWQVAVVSSTVQPNGALLVTANFSDGNITHQRSVQVFNPTAATINEALRRERMLLESAVAISLPVGSINIDAV